MKRNFTTKLNEYFQINKRGLYDLWKLDHRKGFYRHAKEMDYKEYKAYQAESGWTISCKTI